MAAASNMTKTQRKIHKLLMEGKDPTAIIDYGTAKKEKGMSKANVYKTIRLLEKEGLYEASGKTLTELKRNLLDITLRLSMAINIYQILSVLSKQGIRLIVLTRGLMNY